MFDSNTPLVFDIVRGSFIDGPGIRTVIFFKGCPLSCLWCHNPEAQSSEQEYYIDLVNSQTYAIDQSEKDNKQIIGYNKSPEELAEIIMRDKTYYETSNGGVTFSGGEPLMFIDYMSKLCRMLKKDNINISVQTCGYFNYHYFESNLLPFIDSLQFDLKIINASKHIEFTGKSNELILRNFQKLLISHIDILPCIPLVQGITATKENLSEIAELLKKYDIINYKLLPYNSSVIDKLKRLEKRIPPNIPEIPMSLEEEQKWSNYFRECMKI